MNSNKTLDNLVFTDKYDFNAFENILKVFGNISPKKIPRQDFNNLNGNFLVETWENKTWKNYDLYLPDDLKVFELPAIISKINKMTFWEILPSNASKEELKVKIAITIDTLIQILNKKTWKNETKEIQRAIKKYIKLFQDLYWIEESQKLSDENYRNEIIKKWEKTSSYSIYRDFKVKMININTKENLENLLWEIEQIVWKEVVWHFEESFLEDSINLLRYWLSTITKWEIKFLKSNSKNSDNLQIKVDVKNLDEQEKLLREKIWIDKLKKELEVAKMKWDEKLLIETEIKITNIILSSLRDFPYFTDKNYNWFQPTSIIKDKKTQCIGFSILWHWFLEEVWIEHQILNIPNHSALEVIIWWKKYYFDPTLRNEISEFDFWEEVWEYKKIIFTDPSWVYEELIGFDSFEIEKTLLSQIYINLWLQLWDKWESKEMLALFDKAISLNKNDSTAHLNRWTYFFDIWDFNKAIINFKTAINLRPDDNYALFNIWLSLSYLWKDKEAIDYFDKAIKINNNFYDAYVNKWVSLSNLWKHSEALKEYEIAIWLRSNRIEAYINKWYELWKIWKYKEALVELNIAWDIDVANIWVFWNIAEIYLNMWNKEIGWLYWYSYQILTWKNTEIKLDINDENKEKIKKIIASNNFFWLKSFLKEQEKLN